MSALEKRILAGAAVAVFLVLAWGWAQRNGRLKAEGAADLDKKARVAAVAHADSVERGRVADSTRYALQRDTLRLRVAAASVARQQAEARATTAGLNVDAAAHEALAAAGDSVKVVEKINALTQAHDVERQEWRSALLAEQQRGEALGRAVAVADSATAGERAGRLAEKAAKEAALAEVAALRAAQPGFFEKWALRLLPPLAFVGGVVVGVHVG